MGKITRTREAGSATYQERSYLAQAVTRCVALARSGTPAELGLIELAGAGLRDLVDEGDPLAHPTLGDARDQERPELLLGGSRVGAHDTGESSPIVVPSQGIRRRRARELSTEDAVRLALRTQQVIAHETGVTATADPLGGS